MTDNIKKNKMNEKNFSKKTEESSIDTKKQDVSKKEIAIEDKLIKTEEKLLRSLAEIENQRRRFEKEIKDAFEFGSFNFAKESLAALDNLQRAKEAIKNDDNLKTNKDLDKFLENITIVEKDLISIFEKNKIKKIDTKGQKFNPNIHQAMSEIEDVNAETGAILQEIQAGYMLGERLLRPALVAVAKKNVTKNQENNNKKEGA
jgi:molecular chaperone GrpE